MKSSSLILRRAIALAAVAFAFTLSEPCSLAKDGADDGPNHDATEHVGGDDHGGASASKSSSKSKSKSKRSRRRKSHH